jgi:hypothetical protein
LRKLAAQDKHVKVILMKVSDYIVRFLIQHGRRPRLRGIRGMITHLLDSCYRLGGVQVVSVRHEQAAGFAAEGYARMTGVPGVALATSGPGATNLLTAIGSCYFDSTPAVFITGQVNRHERKGHRDIRQGWVSKKPTSWPSLGPSPRPLGWSSRPKPCPQHAGARLRHRARRTAWTRAAGHPHGRPAGRHHRADETHEGHDVSWCQGTR